MIGGALAKPVDALPGLFSPGSIWDRFPYLLPNLFSACCVFIGVIIGILFLEETHAERKKQRDWGLELGKSLLARLPWCKAETTRKAEGKRPAKNPEEQPLLSDSDELLPVYLTESTAEESLDLEEGGGDQSTETEKEAVANIFTKPVVTVIASYGILAL